MLQKEAIDGSTLGLLKSLQSKPYLKGFYLAGGTALARYNGHRLEKTVLSYARGATGKL